MCLYNFCFKFNFLNFVESVLTALSKGIPRQNEKLNKYLNNIYVLKLYQNNPKTSTGTANLFNSLFKSIFNY